jgi:dTDP-4-amino-4,6-dideoxygalactose transaminase
MVVPHSRPAGGAAERRNLLRVLASGQWGPGPEARRFEGELARRVGRRRALAVQSGSVALELALRAIGMGPGRRVAIPSYTCAAVLNAVRAVGAREALVDADPDTGSLDPDRLPRGVHAAVVPHLFGAPARLPHGLPVVEDCAGGLGEGLGRRGLVAVCSFYATKLLGAGQGGAVLTDRADLAARLEDLVGYDKRPDYRLRFNYRMSDLTAAVARAQAARLPAFLRARRRLAALYRRALRGLPLRLPDVPGHQYSRFVVGAPGVADRLLRHLNRRGIEAKRPVFRPLHRYLGRRGFPVTDRLHEESVSLPIYPSLGAARQRRVVRAVRSFFA